MTNTNLPTVALELNTTRNPNDPSGTDTWVNITSYATEITTKRGRPDELADVQAATMDLVLLNDASRFDPNNASGPYYPNLLAWRQARATASWPASYVMDTFSRPNSSTGLGVASSGQTWTNGAGITGVQSERAYAPSAGDNIGLVNAGATDAVARVTISTTASGGAGAVVRATDASNFYLATQHVSTTIRLFKRVAGTYTQLGGDFAHTSAAGDVISVSAVGTTISALLNGVAVITVTDSSLTSGTKAGTYIDNATSRLSGFSVAPPTQVTYSVFRGYEETFWPQSWTDAGTKGWCKPTFIDAFAALGKIVMDECVIEETLLDNPLALYPLSDAGGTQAGNISGTKQDNATVTPSSDTGTYAFGSSSILPGAPSLASWHVAGGANVVPGPYLTLPAGARPTVGAGCTFEWWFTKASFANTLQMLAGQITADAAALAVYASASNGGTVVAFMRGTSGGGTFTPFSTPITPGAPTHVAVTLNAAGTQITLYVNGVNVGTASSGTISAFSAVQFGGVSTPASDSASFSVLATHNAELSAARIAAHYTAGLNAFAGEVPSARVARLLSYGAWLTALENIDTTSVGDTNTPLLGATDIGDKNILQALKDICSGVLADLDVDGDGKVRYRSRDARLLQTTPAYTFGENTAGGELPYTDLPETGAKPDFLFSQIQVNQVNGITAIRGDATANLRYFPTTLTKTTYLQDPAMVLDLADDLLRRYKDPHERAASFVLDPASNPNLWPAVLGMDYGTRIRVMRRPPNGAVKTIDCYVESISHHINFAQGIWQTTVTTSAAPPFFPWILGDSTYSVLGTSTTPVF